MSWKDKIQLQFARLNNFVLTPGGVDITCKRYLMFYHGTLYPICPIRDNFPYVTDLKQQVLFSVKTVHNGFLMLKKIRIMHFTGFKNHNCEFIKHFC